MSEVSLRAANVVRADAAAIQLLCSFAKTANKEHMLFKLDQPSDEIKKSLTQLQAVHLELEFTAIYNLKLVCLG